MPQEMTEKALTGTVRDGQIVPDGRIDWPDGTKVAITPQPKGAEKWGLDESEWRDDPKAIEDWIRWYRALEPLELTPEEEAAWQAARKSQKDYEVGNFDTWIRQIEGLFE